MSDRTLYRPMTACTRDIPWCGTTTRRQPVAAKRSSRRIAGWVLACLIATAAGVSVAHWMKVTVPVVAASPSHSDAIPGSQPLPASSGMTEGVDYSYIAYEHGRIVRWPCTGRITIAMLGKGPRGGADALTHSISTLRDITRLPLIDITGSPQAAQADVLIRYTARDIDGDPRILGSTRSRHAGGIFTRSWILLRADVDPASDTGTSTFLHELAHALGAGHATQGTGELMQPTLTRPGSRVGKGDRYALTTLGCTSPT